MRDGLYQKQLNFRVAPMDDEDVDPSLEEEVKELRAILRHMKPKRKQELTKDELALQELRRRFENFKKERFKNA